jgi:hypothetical protein
LVFAGFALSFVFNLLRMTLLTEVAATQGIAAIASWHDPAGVLILLACFLGIWGVAVWFQARRSKRAGHRHIGETHDEKSTASHSAPTPQASESTLNPRGLAFPIPTPSPLRLSSPFFLLAVWVLFAEVSIEIWYRVHETRQPRAMQWTVAWPVNHPSFKELPIPSRTRQLLRYDEGRGAAWLENGMGWQAVFLRWKPGRSALNLAGEHTPQGCMLATGRTVNVISKLEWVQISGPPGRQIASIMTDEPTDPGSSGVPPSEFAGTNCLRLPFAIYEVAEARQTYFIFYCLWDDRAGLQGFERMELTRFNRLAAVLAGVRNVGQRSLEIAITGPRNARVAEITLCAELGKLIQYQPQAAWR